MATLKEVQSAAREVVNLIRAYQRGPSGEMDVDRILYAFFRGRFQNASRQYLALPVGGAKGRIDFRLGGNNPIVVELATKTEQGGGVLTVGGNKPELGKLSRIPQERARVRILLLLNLTTVELDFERLKAGYQEYHLGQGRYSRRSVSVVYVSPSIDRRFSWSPFKT